jgi:branched-chain amino acid transport system substrate-binding protein
VAAEGFEGVMGNLTFEGNDLRVNGVLVKWDGSQEQLASK